MHRARRLFPILCGLLPVLAARSAAQPAETVPAADLVVVNARISTLEPGSPDAGALAVRGGVFVAVGDRGRVERLIGPDTTVVDAGGRRVVPGLNDSHLHAVRAGRFYTLELRWDGVASLARGLHMIREQAGRTPDDQWVRVVGGWSPYQFSERRMPTIAELNDAAPDTPVLVVFLYSQGFLNRAGVRALGLTPDSQPPKGGRYEFVDGGAILHAEPNPTILYSTISRLPQLSHADQVSSTAHFFRELNRFGVTSAIDPGGGGHAYPGDYAATAALAARPGFPVRISNYLFAQRAGAEFADYERWTSRERLNLNLAASRLNGYLIEGAGENLVWAAGDFENFMAPRPELAEGMETELAAVVRLLAEHDWPIRIHATYDESISRVLDVFEPIFEETGYRARWAIDHAETVSPRNLERIKALGGSIAVQNRMAFAGELFAERYGPEAAAAAPPIRAMLDAGIPVAAGTDATRVSSYNPWLSLHWLVTGQTLGGETLFAERNRLTREEALRLFTVGSAYLSGEEHLKGRIAPGQYADFVVLNHDYFTTQTSTIREIESVLTVSGGEPVFVSPELAAQVDVPELPPVTPSWSPVAAFGGYQRAAE